MQSVRFARGQFRETQPGSPKVNWGTVMSWHSRYCPFLFGQDRKTAARLAEAILVAYAKALSSRLKRSIRVPYVFEILL